MQYLELFVRQLAIFILVSKLKHLLNIFISNWYRQVLHYVNEIFLETISDAELSCAAFY